jgi:trigger factor
MKTNVQELPDSRVRVEVDVPPDDVDRQLNRAARGIARDLRLPGFRKGKAPPSLVIQRVGREAVLEQALQDSLPEWYERALLDSGVTPVGDPKLEVTSLPEEGESLSFAIEVGVRPRAQLGNYRGLEVGRPEPEVPDDVVEQELERTREGFARLEPVERKSAAGDVIVVDFRGTIDGEPFEGGEARDYLLELGSGQLIEGFDENLTGLGAGEERDIEITFPTDYQPERLAGQRATFHVDVKEVREKKLPDLDDDFAAEASEFDTLEELRGDLRAKLGEAAERRIESDFRISAVDAAVAEARVDLPDELVTARATERWERLERELAARGIDPNAYLRMQGRSREQVIEESKPDAERELKRDAVLEAIADAEEIEISDEEMVEALAHSAEHERTSPEKLLERLRANGRDALIRQDLRMRKALDLLAESSKPIPVAQAEARERLWTPEKERDEAGEGAGLWTPGSD